MNPVMNPIDPMDARRRQPMQGDVQQPTQKQQIMQALISPQQFAFGAGKNFEGMYYNPQQQQAPQQPQYQPQQPQNVGQGVAAMGDAMAHRARERQGAFPKAPGNNPMAPFGRLMGMFSKPGLR